MTKKKFDGKESYTHLYAKQLLAEWLRSDELNFQCGEFTTNIKRMNDVVLEYPIMDCFPYLPEEFGKSKWTAVADIAVKHEGIIPYIFEIVNKNEDVNKKLFFYLSKKEIIAFFISATHILGQIKKPTLLKTMAMAYYGQSINPNEAW